MLYSVAKSCPTLCDPMDCRQPCSSVHEIFQARILKQIAISSSRVYLPNPGIKPTSHALAGAFITTALPGVWKLRPNSILGRPLFYWYNVNNIFTFLKLNHYCVLSVTWFLPPRSWSHLEERRLLQKWWHQGRWHVSTQMVINYMFSMCSKS